MNRDNQTWIGARFAQLSTGLKMLLILSFGLFPLGLIAVVASIDSARQNMADRRDDTFTRLEIKAQRINAALDRSAITIGAASAAIDSTEAGSGVCRRTLGRLGRSNARYALFADDGSPRCATAGFSVPTALPKPARRAVAEIVPDGSALRLFVFGEDRRIEGIAEYPREALREIAYIPGTSPDFDLTLSQGPRRMELRHGYVPGTLVQTISGSEDVADGQLKLSIALGAAPLSASELVMILLPVLMCLAAAIIGWLIVDRLLLRPLARMQRAVAAYQPGDSRIDLPSISSPAREIGELGSAFNQVTQTVARHEAELEAAIERQTRLVREVHHRVKNNLQVVASLLNLHARGAPNEQVSAAYASIQRRVDALAVVHRNHYAELEVNRGVALRSLISELASNLRATAPASASSMTIALHLEPLYVTQDVAVSVAFLITEIVEFAMLTAAPTVVISLESRSDKVARLTIGSPSLKAGTDYDPNLFERFDRIVTGLSRQLRSAMDRDLDRGRYSLDIAINARGEG
ncbi:MAG: HAMP domain-containing protein [Alphaproteobacteria bacterium]|nr:MAG: HAMP domain-containing protein [Alphaproteobacteria bacterium]